MSRSDVKVVVVYDHPLLGEGLASLLSTHAGVHAVAVATDDSDARAAALTSRPDLVIVEETDGTRTLKATDSLPVVFIRVNADDGGRMGEPLADPDAILALVDGLPARR